MSTFAASARRITVTEHPNADALDLAQIQGTDYVAIIGKGSMKTGDVAVYIQEGSIVPDNIILEMGLVDKLAGGTVGEDGKKQKNRVKAIRLRQVLSQGLVYAAPHLELEEGVDYAEALGITKYMPPIPLSMAGDVVSVPDLLQYTDIENVKHYPDVLVPGEEVVAFEKAHGTRTIFSWNRGQFNVSSKGFTQKGLAFDENASNVYWRVARAYDVENKLAEFAQANGFLHVTMYAETLGVQNLMYGLPKGELSLTVFDLKVGDGGAAKYLDVDDIIKAVDSMNLTMVPLLYRGAYSRDVLNDVAVGTEQITGSETHIREGVVVRPVRERRDDVLGRVILKFISPEYLLLKGLTEYD